MAIDIEWQPKPPGRNGEDTTSEVFPRIVNSDVVEEQRLAELVSAHGALSKGTVITVLNDLAEVMAELLGDGKTVELPMFGTFRLAVGSRGLKAPSTIRSVRNVEVRGINFQASNELMNGIARPDFNIVARNAAPLVPSAADLVAPLSEYLESHAFITRTEFAALFKLKRTTACDRLNELQEMGVIKSVGYNRETKYTKI